jgi:hypothetical protein
MANSPVIWLLLGLVLSGCVQQRGVLYTDMIKPATIDFSHTPIGTKHCSVVTHRIKEPVTRHGIYVEWNQNYFKAMAAKAGITNLYYIDERTRSYVFGIYRQRTWIFHGD